MRAGSPPSPSPSPSSPPPSHGRRLARDAGGAVVIEYTMLLIFVALPIAFGLTAGGVMMLKEYRMARDLILLPVP
jgi:hypothetical protein